MNYFERIFINILLPVILSAGISHVASGKTSGDFISATAAQQVILGDVDGNGILNMEDAKFVVKYILGQVSPLPKPENADVNQDGKITIDDAYSIARKISGKTLIVIAGPDKGLPGKAEIGTLVRVEVFEKFFPYNITGGTVRIVSESNGYDSGTLPLTFERNGRSLYYLWETGGLTPSVDYNIFVSLSERNPTKADNKSSAEDIPVESITLDKPIFEIPYLTQSQDGYALAPGLPLVFSRTFQSNHETIPYLGPLGRGWWHNFDVHLVEETNGIITFLTEVGNGRRFTSNVDGSYTASPGDYAKLSRDPDGSFVLREKNGLVYHFRSDLMFDFIQDLNGNRITAFYNQTKKLIRVQHTSGTSFKFDYNANGRISKFTDNNGKETTYTYDDFGDHLLIVTAPGDRVTKYAYGGALFISSILVNNYLPNYHRLQSITFPDNTHRFFTYDEGGRITSIEGSWGSGKLNFSYEADGTTHITDSLGKTTSIKVNQQKLPVEIINPLGYKTQYIYDNNSNLTRIIDQSGYISQFEYNSRGNLVRMLNPANHEIIAGYDPEINKISSLKDSRGLTTNFKYDPAGNLMLITYPDGSKEGFDFNPNGTALSKTDRNGNIIIYKYNSLGLLLEKTYPDKTKASFTYNTGGKMTSATNYTGTINYKYDELNRLTEVTYPGNRTFKYLYDKGNKRTRMTDPDGRIENYVYDGAGRLYKITDNAGNTIAEYWYDEANRRAGRGLANGIYSTYKYDAAGQLLELNYYNKGKQLISFFQYTYDPNGNRLTKKSTDGTETYTYDQLNQLTKVVYPDASVEEFIYDEMGNRKTVRQNGVPVGYSANNLNQYSTVGTATYQYDKNGNLISKTESGKVTKYVYDYENRLINVQTPTITTGYSYNPFGLRNSQTQNGKFTGYLLDGAVVSLEEDALKKTMASYTWGGYLDEVIKMERNNSQYYYAQDAMLSTSDIFNPEGLPIEHYKYKVFGEPQNVSGIGNPWYFTGLSYDFNANLQYNRNRFYSPKDGRFINSDPFGLSGGINLYSYAQNNPLSFIDPYGTYPVWIGVTAGILLVVHIIEWTAGVIQTGYSYSPHDAPEGHFPPDPAPNNNPRPEYEQSDNNIPPDNETPTGESDSSDNYPNKKGIGGICPTFIQLPPEMNKNLSTTTNLNVSTDKLSGRITVPVPNSLLRADIPIFGIAGGKNFKSYKVQYGKGPDPKTWSTIESSDKPQDKNNVGIEQIPNMQGDIDIRGNLATWNTGLKNWSHLPWHPAEDTTDFNGVYTIRLLVEGTDGSQTEDRVTCEVGRAIAQCLPGIAISPDKKVILHFPEQSLTSPFRVYSILPASEANEEIPAPPEKTGFVGNIYRVREPGDRFAKPVKLEFVVTNEELNKKKIQNIGLANYDFQLKKWNWLPSENRTSNDTVFFYASITELPSPKALFALLSENPGSKRSELHIEAEKSITSVIPVSNEVLVLNTFEDNTGMWKAGDQFVGAQVSTDTKSTPDGSKALKITGTNHGGNFSVTAVDQSFDVRDYPLLSFDYKVEPGVNTDFYILINNRWYNLGFTGDTADFSHSDVNIANLGRFDNIPADNQWHSTSINLYELIRLKTKHTRVDAIRMADWQPGGYMKLDFGNNSRSASYYIDNFKLTSGPKYDMPEILQVDDFNSNKPTNMLGGPNGSFANPGTDYMQAKIDIAEQNIKKTGKNINSNGSLMLTFDASADNSYCGYWTSLLGKDFTDLEELHFRIRTTGKMPEMLAGLRHAKQTAESAVPVREFLSGPDKAGWYDVAIPLSAFIGYGLPDLTSTDVLFFKFEKRISSGKGVVFIDDIQIRNELSNTSVVTFNNADNAKNRLGGGSRVIEQSAATISGDNFKDIITTADSVTNSLRISYGGTIGLSYGGRNFSYAMWETDLMGLDASKYKNIVLRIRGQKGGEQPNIYLDDACRRACLRPQDFRPISDTWQDLRLPLKKFTDLGIDITNLDKLQITFEWKEMSGTIYLNEIYFE